MFAFLRCGTLSKYEANSSGSPSGTGRAGGSGGQPGSGSTASWGGSACWAPLVGLRGCEGSAAEPGPGSERSPGVREGSVRDPCRCSRFHGGFLTCRPGRCAALSGGSALGPGRAWDREPPSTRSGAVRFGSLVLSPARLGSAVARLRHGSAQHGAGGARPPPPPRGGGRVWSGSAPEPRPVPPPSPRSRAELRAELRGRSAARCRSRCRSAPRASFDLIRNFFSFTPSPFAKGNKK